MLSSLFSRPEYGGPPTYIHTIAIPLIGAGIAILAAPGFRDLVLHFLDKTFKTNLDFAQSPTTGFTLLALGILIYAMERLVDAFGGKPLLALRHQSFLPLPPTLSRNDLPNKIAMKRVRSIDCDLYPVMSASPQNLEAALTIQTDWAQKVVGAITGAPDAPVAYYGIVHIPFQLLAGCRFSTYRRIELFELERGTNKWRGIAGRKKTPPLALNIDRVADVDAFDDVSIRISISYLVNRHEVAKILPRGFIDIHLRIASPQIDAIQSIDDIRQISAAFRREIDSELVRGKRVHIFYSGPVSLGFSLGQQISPSIHGEVHVYNYDAQASPSYGWSIQMTNIAREANVRRY